MMMGKTVVLLVMLAVMRVAMAGNVYKVGDSFGWTNNGNVDYKSWSSSKQFHVGDTIVFEYNKEFHNVERVTHKNFQKCNIAAPYGTYSTGNDSFTIKAPGHYYFICGIPGHCQSGQKVDIRVTAATPPPPSHGMAPIEPLPFPYPPPTIPSPSPAPSQPPSIPSPSPAPSQPPSIPSPPPSQPPSIPSPPPSQPPSSDSQSPEIAPAPHKNGGSQLYSFKLWMTMVALVVCVFGMAY